VPVSGPVVLFSHPDAVREIFTGDSDALRAGQANVILGPILGGASLLLLDGARHLRERRMMLPPFHGERMLAYGTVMREVTERAIARWPLGRPFPVLRETQAITLDVIVRTVFGVADPERAARITDRLRRFVAIAVNPALPLAAPAARLGTVVAVGPLRPAATRDRHAPRRRAGVAPSRRQPRPPTTCCRC